jgi:hypothetical protein
MGTLYRIDTNNASFISPYTWEQKDGRKAVQIAQTQKLISVFFRNP